MTVRKSGLNPNDRNAMARVVEMLRIWNGEGRNPEEAVVTRKDLQSLLSGVVVGTGSGSSGSPGATGPTGPQGPAGPPGTELIEAPTLPQGVEVFSTFGAVLLVWLPYGYSGHSHTEVWRSTANVLGDAVKIGETPGGMYQDFTVVAGVTYYYWVRFVNKNGEPGPYHSTLGLAVEAVVPAEYLLEELTGKITSDQLFVDLATRIGLIDASASVEGSVAWQLAQEASARAAAVGAVANDLFLESSDRIAAVNMLAEELAQEVTSRAAAVNTVAENLAQEILDRVAAVSGVAGGLSQEVADRIAAILAEAAARGTDIAFVQGQIDSIASQVADLSGTPDFDEDNSYEPGNLVRYQGGLYLNIQATVPPSPLPTNTEYWTKVGDYASLGDAVTAMAGQISSLDLRVTDNEGEISSVASGLSSLQATVTNTETGLASKAAITYVDTAVATETSARVEALAALSSVVDDPTTGLNARALQTDFVTLDVQVNHPTTGLPTRAAASALTSLQAIVDDPTTGLASRASQFSLTTLENQINHPTTGLPTRASAEDLDVLEAAVLDPEAGLEARALQTNFTALSAQVNHPTTGLPTRAAASALTTLETTVNNPMTGLASRAAQASLTILENQVNDATTGLPTRAAASALSALETTINDPAAGLNSRALQSSFVTLDNQVNHPTTGLPTRAAASALTTLETTINDPAAGLNSRALQSSFVTLDNQVNHPTTGLPTRAAASALTTLETTVNNPTTGLNSRALQSSFVTLDNQVNDATTGLPTRAAASALDALATTVNDPMTGLSSRALQSSFVTLNNQVSHPSTGLATRASAEALSTLEARVDDIDLNPDTSIFALKTDVTALNVQVNHPSTGLATRASAEDLATLEARVDGIDLDPDTSIFALKTDLTTLDVQVNHPSTGLGTRAAAFDLNTLQTAVNNPTTGLASRASQSSVTDLFNQVNHPTTGLPTRAAASALTTLETTVDHPTTGLSSRALQLDFTTLSNQVNHPTTGLATRADASSLNTLQTTVNDPQTGLNSRALQSNFTDLSNQVNHPVTGLPTRAAASALGTLETTVNNPTTGISARALQTDLASLDTQVNHPSTGLPTRASATALTGLEASVNARSANKVNPLNVLGLISGWQLPTQTVDGVFTVSGRTQVMRQQLRTSGVQMLSDWFDIDDDGIYEVTLDYWADAIGALAVALYCTGPGSTTDTTQARTVSSTGVVGGSITADPYWVSSFRGTSAWRRTRCYLYGSAADTLMPVPAAQNAHTHGWKVENGKTRARLRLLAGYTLVGGTVHQVYWTNVQVRRLGDSGLAGVSELKQAITTGDNSAVSTATQQVYTTLGGNQAIVQTKAQSWDGTSAHWSVKTDVSQITDNALVGGIGLLNDGQSTRFYVQADRFAIYDSTLPANPQTALVPFAIEDGRVYIKDAVIKTGSITSAKIGTVEVGSLRVVGSSNQAAIADAIIPNAWIDMLKIANVLQSTNWNAAANTGWQINKAGTATFNNVTVRGTVFATAGQFTGTLTAGLINLSALTLDSMRITAIGSRTAPLIVYDHGMVGTASGSTVTASRTITLAGFRGPAAGADGLFHHKRFVRHKMDVLLEAQVSCAGGSETVVIEYRYDGGTWFAIWNHTFNGNNRTSFDPILRFTTRAAAWNTLDFRISTTQGQTLHLMFKVTCYNQYESSNPDNSNSTPTGNGGGHGGNDPIPPPGYQIP